MAAPGTREARPAVPELAQARWSCSRTLLTDSLSTLQVLCCGGDGNWMLPMTSTETCSSKRLGRQKFNECQCQTVDMSPSFSASLFCQSSIVSCCSRSYHGWSLQLQIEKCHIKNGNERCNALFGGANFATRS
jgi:hypothetical protein